MTAAARLGVAEHSFYQRILPNAGTAKNPGFGDRVELVRHAAELGAAGVQVSTNGWTNETAARVRAITEPAGMYVEGEPSLPKTTSSTELDRFERELVALRAAGGAIGRVVLHGGRRYEELHDASAFEAWRTDAWARLRAAERVARKVGVKLAIENHKDLRTDELVEGLRALSSAHVGTCVDTGNNLALLEDPMAVVEALAPFALTSHLKDLAVRPCPEGFLMSEVPLGDGFLDLPAIVAKLRAANPRIRFNLEMITRDPLVIPCLTDAYWVTMGRVPARELGHVLGIVRRQTATKLPSVQGLDADARFALEDAHVRRSLTVARERLAL
jgi:sugar phosphate isomerase/epimerase